MNGVGQLGAVTRPYIGRIKVRKFYRAPFTHVRSTPLGGGLGVCSPRKFLDFRVSVMVSDAFLNKKEPANA